MRHNRAGLRALARSAARIRSARARRGGRIGLVLPRMIVHGPVGVVGTSKVLVPALIGLALVITFVLYSFKPKHPLLDLWLFRNRSLAVSIVTMFLFAVAFFGGLLLVPTYFQQIRGESVLRAGLLVAPQAIGAMLTLQRPAGYRIPGDLSCAWRRPGSGRTGPAHGQSGPRVQIPQPASTGTPRLSCSAGKRPALPGTSSRCSAPACIGFSGATSPRQQHTPSSARSPAF
jgi:hypothetical protein